MAEARIETRSNPSNGRDLKPGSHYGYVFMSSSDKQAKLFEICKDALLIKSSGILYIAGKQGVKGIRLSLKDIGLEVSSYERIKQFKIVDSEEWFTLSARTSQFKKLDELESQFKKASDESVACGFSYLTVVSETDMLVRKGFLSKYKEFDKLLNQKVRELKLAFVCAFDKRELQAANVSDPTAEISELHEFLI